MNLEKMGKFISKLRGELNITQAQLGEKLGVDNKIISKWKNGINAPDIQQFIELSNIFNVRVEEIVDGEYKDKFRYEKIAEDHSLTGVSAPVGKSRQTKYLLSIIIVLLIIFIVLAIYNGRGENFIVNDFNNDPATPINVNGYVKCNRNTCQYVIKNITYELNDEITKTESIKQFEIKLVVNSDVISTYSHKLDKERPLNEALNNVSFSLEEYKKIDNNSIIEIQINYINANDDLQIYKQRLK